MSIGSPALPQSWITVFLVFGLKFTGGYDLGLDRKGPHVCLLSWSLASFLAHV